MKITREVNGELVEIELAESEMPVMLYDVRRIDHDLPMDQQQRILDTIEANDAKQALTYFYRKHDMYMGYTRYLEASKDQCFASTLSAVNMATVRRGTR